MTQSQQNVTVALIDANRESLLAAEEMLRPYSDRLNVCVSTAIFASAIESIRKLVPKIVILAVYDLAQGIEQVREIHANSSQSIVFVVSQEKESDWILGLMRAGAVEYLLKPLGKADLFDAIQKSAKLWQNNHVEDVSQKGKVISIYNPIGGMGTTTIAVNLAVALAKGGNKVALVDLNLFSGDVATFLDVTPRYTLTSVTSNLGRLDAGFLMSVMTQHASGIYLLGEPLEVDDTFSITPEQIQKMLEFLKTAFDYMVIDTGGQMIGTNDAVFRSSSMIIYNTVLNLPSLKNAKRYIAAFEKRGIPREKVKILVNRFLLRSDIKVQDAEKVLDRKLFLTIPNEYNDVNDSINKGVPVVNLYPRSEVSKAVIALAEMIKQQLK